MVYQVRAGYAIAGVEIKVPQVFIPGCMRAVIIARTSAGSLQLNTLHAAVPTPPVSNADVVALAAAIDNWITSDYETWFSSDITVEAVHVRSMEGLTVPQTTLANTHVGNLTGQVLPYSVSIPVELGTNLTGQENAGEFWPFTATEAENDPDQRPSSVYALGIQSVMDALGAAVNAVGFSLVVASFTYSSMQDVTNFVVRRQWGTQRRRLTQYGM